MEEESSSGSGNSSEGDMDDENSGEELLQTSLPTSQKSEEPPVSVLTGIEPTTRELKAARDMGTEDREVAISKVASTMGDFTPAGSQDKVRILE